MGKSHMLARKTSLTLSEFSVAPNLELRNLLRLYRLWSFWFSLSPSRFMGWIMKHSWLRTMMDWNILERRMQRARRTTTNFTGLSCPCFCMRMQNISAAMLCFNFILALALSLESDFGEWSSCIFFQQLEEYYLRSLSTLNRMELEPHALALACLDLIWLTL